MQLQFHRSSTRIQRNHCAAYAARNNNYFSSFVDKRSLARDWHCEWQAKRGDDGLGDSVATGRKYCRLASGAASLIEWQLARGRFARGGAGLASVVAVYAAYGPLDYFSDRETKIMRPASPTPPPLSGWSCTGRSCAGLNSQNKHQIFLSFLFLFLAYWWWAFSCVRNLTNRRLEERLFHDVLWPPMSTILSRVS